MHDLEVKVWDLICAQTRRLMCAQTRHCRAPAAVVC